MTDNVPASCRVTIINKRGLHARASAKFSVIASAYDADIEVTHNDLTVDGSSLMDLLMLGAGKGCVLKISATGIQRAEAIDTLQKLIADKFGEQD